MFSQADLQPQRSSLTINILNDSSHDDSLQLLTTILPKSRALTLEFNLAFDGPATPLVRMRRWLLSGYPWVLFSHKGIMLCPQKLKFINYPLCHPRVNVTVQMTHCLLILRDRCAMDLIASKQALTKDRMFTELKQEKILDMHQDGQV